MNLDNHESHRVFSVPMYWECVAAETANPDVRDEIGDECDQECAAEALRPPVMMRLEEH
jgi:hypothetical protein